MKTLEYLAVVIVVFGTLLSVPSALADEPTVPAAVTLEMTNFVE